MVTNIRLVSSNSNFHEDFFIRCWEICVFVTIVHIFIKIEFLKILYYKIRRPNKASFWAAIIFFCEVYVLAPHPQKKAFVRLGSCDKLKGQSSNMQTGQGFCHQWFWILIIITHHYPDIESLDFLAFSGAEKRTFWAFLGPWNQAKPFRSYKGP